MPITNVSFVPLMVFAACLCGSGDALTTVSRGTTATRAYDCSTLTYTISTRTLSLYAIRNSHNDDHRSSCDSSSSSTRLSASRRDALTNTFTNIAAGMTLLSGMAPDSLAFAATDSSQAPVVTTCEKPCFTGVWSDPKHPNGYRVLIQKSSFVANMFLSDGNDEKSYKNLRVKVEKDKKKGETYLTFDFSDKGGPNNIVGTLEDDGTKIRFPDGNVWTKNAATAVEGVYATDPRVAGEGYRVVVIRKDGDNRLAVQLNNKQAITATIDDLNKNDGVGVRFIFPDNQVVEATYQNRVIKFPFPVQSNAFGNTFTKWDEWTKL